MSLEDYDEFFDQLDSDKQERIEVAAVRIMLRGMKRLDKLPELKSRAQAERNDDAGLTPEFVCQAAGWPIMLRAVRDWKLEKAHALPDPLWLLDHRIDSARTRGFYANLWKETEQAFRSTHAYYGVIFKTDWSEHLLVLHNYKHVLNHVSSKTFPVRGGLLLWATDQGVLVLQYLRDLVSAVQARS